MKRLRKLIVMMLSIALAAGSLTITASADAIATDRVVTLGVDLSDAQQAAMLKYFGVTESDVDIIYVNNAQERAYLGAYVPLEQIGDRTFSCSYVKPTTSGGIKVKIANLNWVTCNMIATTLSTCGVNNCQVVAAAPIEVSGTGALTGIIIAYQQASGTELDQNKVDLANREMIETANLSDEIGQSNATAVVNETKLQAIENNITNVEEITNIVNNISNEYNVTIDNDQAEQIAELVAEIAQQDYEIDQLKQNLAAVQANVVGDTDASEEVQESVEARNEEYKEEAASENITEDETGDGETAEEIQEAETEEENILDNTDSSALSEDGSAVQESDTMSTVVEQETTTAEDDGWEVFDFDDQDQGSSDGQESQETQATEETMDWDYEETQTEETAQTPETETQEIPAVDETPDYSAYSIYQGTDSNGNNWTLWVNDNRDKAGLICQNDAETKSLTGDYASGLADDTISIFGSDGTQYDILCSAYDNTMDLTFGAESAAAAYFNLYQDTSVNLYLMNLEMLSDYAGTDGYEQFCGFDSYGNQYVLAVGNDGSYVLKSCESGMTVQTVTGYWEINDAGEFVLTGDDGTVLSGNVTTDIYNSDYSIVLTMNEENVQLVRVCDELTDMAVSLNAV